jgi:hypothetical protein
MKKEDKEVKDLRCLDTKMNRLIYKDGELPRVAPIVSMRNRPNEEGILFSFGKRAGTPKPYKHKDLQ